jgi:hypothetical protein
MQLIDSSPRRIQANKIRPIPVPATTALERPILFSAPMVRALLDGSKTQTRRVVKPAPIADQAFVGGFYIPSTKRAEGARLSVEAPYVAMAYPYGRPGDRLWVREAWATRAIDPECTVAAYRATDDECNGPWKPSIHMPRWASRIDLEITGVRVERLQDINEADAEAEGVHSWGRGALSPEGQEADPSDKFRWLWSSINGADSWSVNPWVWVVQFRRVKP